MEELQQQTFEARTHKQKCQDIGCAVHLHEFDWMFLLSWSLSQSL